MTHDPCGAPAHLRTDPNDPGKSRYCERPAGHDGRHMARYCGERRYWPAKDPLLALLNDLPDPHGTPELEDHRIFCICHFGGRPFHYEAYEVQPDNPHLAVNPDHQKFIDAIVLLADATGGDQLSTHTVAGRTYVETIIPFLQ